MSAATLVEVLLAAIVLLGIGFACVQALPAGDVEADEPPPPLPAGPILAEDLEDARFPLAFRGYRMAEVDDALDRAATAIATRDALIAELRGEAQATAEPVPVSDAGSGSGSEIEAADAPDAPVVPVVDFVKPDNPFAGPPRETETGA